MPTASSFESSLMMHFWHMRIGWKDLPTCVILCPRAARTGSLCSLVAPATRSTTHPHILKHNICPTVCRPASWHHMLYILPPGVPVSVLSFPTSPFEPTRPTYSAPSEE